MSVDRRQELLASWPSKPSPTGELVLTSHHTTSTIHPNRKASDELCRRGLLRRRRGVRLDEDETDDMQAGEEGRETKRWLIGRR